MKKKKQKLNYLAITIALLLVVLFMWGIVVGVKALVYFFQNRSYSVEDETLFRSPPSSEEIVYRKEKQGLFIVTSSLNAEARKPVQITSEDDYAPSWNTTGTGLYFLRKTESNSINLLYYNREENILEPGFRQSFSELDIPNIETSFIRISPDGKYVIVSSYDWGLTVWNVASGKKESPYAMQEIYRDLGIFSRNNRYFLFTKTNLYDRQFVFGVEKAKPSAELYLASTSLETITPIDRSDSFFQGLSFSFNGYTFSYGKEGNIYYVDSIDTPKPLMITEGSWPDIRPTLSSKKIKQQYKWTPPFWYDFDFTNIAGFFFIPDSSNMLVATPNKVAAIHTKTQRVNIFMEQEGKQESSYLGWKLIDFLYQDINGDQIPELVASWWPGGTEVGAERISLFTLLPNSTLQEQYLSKHAHKNSISFKDLNGDDSKELLNLYLDATGKESSNLENLYWEDVHMWNGKQWQLSNDKFPDEYKKLKDSYEVFLMDAIKKPDDYGESLYLIKDLLDKVKILLKE